MRWLLEASELLEGMAREERHSAAHELQHFVVKSLQVRENMWKMYDVDNNTGKLIHYLDHNSNDSGDDM